MGVSSGFGEIAECPWGDHMMLRLLMALPAALLSPRNGTTAEHASSDHLGADDGACPVCDHPFGNMRHACLA